MSVDQLPVCNEIQGVQDNIGVQIGQSVESDAYPTENVRRNAVCKVFPIFSSNLQTDKQNQIYDNPRGMQKTVLLFTPSKIRKHSIESSTSTNSSEMKNVDTLQGETCESPAKRRRYCGNIRVSQNGSQ